MKQEHDDMDLKKSVKAILDQDVNQMDDQIVGQLRQIRRNAMAEKGNPAVFRWNRLRISLAGAAVGFMIVLIALTVYKGSNRPMTSSLLEDMDIITAKENLDFYEDLDFYAWLVEEENVSENAG